MSRVPIVATGLSRDAMPDAPEGDWLDTVLKKMRELADGHNLALSNGITLADNMASQIVSVDVNIPQSSGAVATPVTGSGTVGQLAAWTGPNTLGDGGVGGGGSVDGSGTAGKFAAWTDADTLEASAIGPGDVTTGSGLNGNIAIWSGAGGPTKTLTYGAGLSLNDDGQLQVPIVGIKFSKDGSVQDSAGGGGSVSGLYWAKPAVANARDEEFDGDMSAWTLGSGIAITGACDPTLNFTTGYRADCNTARPSWVRLQPPRDNTQHQMYQKSITALPGNFVMWFRAAIIWDVDNRLGNADLAVRLLDSVSGDYCYVYANHPDGTNSTVIGRVNVSGVNQQTAITPQINLSTLEWSLFAVQKSGTVLTFWVGNDPGTWRRVTSFSLSAGSLANLDTVQIQVGNGAGNANPNSILCLDFVRFLETSQWPL